MLRGGRVVCGCEHTSRSLRHELAGASPLRLRPCSERILFALPTSLARVAPSPSLFRGFSRCVSEMKRLCLVARLSCSTAFELLLHTAASFSFFLSATSNDRSPRKRKRFLIPVRVTRIASELNTRNQMWR